jgi:NADPH:quinone reductase
VFSEGVDTALELIGTSTLPDTLRSTRVHGVVCFTGMLSNEWIVEKFYPIDYIPRGVRLTAYGGEAADLPAKILQSFIEEVEPVASACLSATSTGSTRSSRRTRRWSRRG